MTDPEHSASFESLGAYVLGALPEAEHEAVARHLDSCPVCAEDAAGLRRAAMGLLESVPMLEPPPELRRRIMATVESEAALLRAASGARPPASPRWRAPARPFDVARVRWVGAAAALLIAGGVLGSVWSDGPAGGARTIAAQAGSSAQRAWLELRGGRAQLVVEGLRTPPRDRVYQVWVQHGSEAPVPAGALFVVRSGRVEIPARLSSGDRVMVSAEPPGGSPEPTSAPVVVTSRV